MHPVLMMIILMEKKEMRIIDYSGSKQKQITKKRSEKRRNLMRRQLIKQNNNKNNVNKAKMRLRTVLSSQSQA